MRIGTTPTHTFVLPFEASDFKKIQIVYSQNDQIILEKTVDDCKLNGNVVSVKLTQEETFKFDKQYSVKIQMRVVTPEGDVLSSDVLSVCCDECLSSEVL